MSDSVKPLNGHALTAPDGVEIKGHLSADTTEILSYPALEFLAAMTREFRARRKQLLELRAQKWQAI